MTISARIFINYRRSDSAGWARQLHGELGARFGAERVFRDVGIEPGVDFVDHIERVMDACEVCIAVIGPRWADTTSAAGVRRLDDPEDLVRREIQRALERPDVHVIPVLVDGARMPAEHELPPELRPLSRRNACELTDARWSSDLDVLCRCLCTVLGESTVGTVRRRAPDRRPGGEAVAEPAAGLLVPVVLTLAAAGCASVVAVALSDGLQGRSTDPDWDRLADYAIERGVIWAIVGAIVAVAVAATFGRVRTPLGHAFMGAGAGWLGGAAGGAGLIALTRFDVVTEEDASWLLQLVLNGLPGLALAGVFARASGTGGAHQGQCALAALGGAVTVLLLPGEGRAVLVTEQVMMVVGAVVAVLATVAPHAAQVSSADDRPRGSRLVGVAGAAARAPRRHRATPPVR